MWSPRKQSMLLDYRPASSNHYFFPFQMIACPVFCSVKPPLIKDRYKIKSSEVPKPCCYPVGFKNKFLFKKWIVLNSVCIMCSSNKKWQVNSSRKNWPSPTDSPFVFERLSWSPKVMAESSGKWISGDHSSQVSANALSCFVRYDWKCVVLVCRNSVSQIDAVESG